MKLELWDIKTSNDIWIEYYLQLAAYRHLCRINLNREDIFDMQCRIVLASKTGEFRAPDIGEGTMYRAEEVFDYLSCTYNCMRDLKGLLKNG